jgi:Reverse transcriptase (RNA-dependent DNA polymerase)
MDDEGANADSMDAMFADNAEIGHPLELDPDEPMLEDEPEEELLGEAMDADHHQNLGNEGPGHRYNLRRQQRVDYSSMFASAGATTTLGGLAAGQRGGCAGGGADPPTPKCMKMEKNARPAGQARTGNGVTHATVESVTVETVLDDEVEGGEHHHEGGAAEDEDAVLGFLLTQVSMRKVLKLFGDKGREAVETELQRLHERQVMQPVAAESLTEEQRRWALAYLMFLKQKRCRKVKGRGCADGRKQRVYTAKEEASSPTVSIESIMLSCVIDAKEGHHVATADIPGAFMQADMDEVVHMRLEGTMIDLLLNVAPEYGLYVTIENGRRVLYVLLTKALCSTLRAALLFWRKLTSQLKEWGFEMNAYDPCVVNHMINGAQCTILWHVDDLKISHVDKAVVEKMLSLLGEVFGKEASLTICHGNIRDYLGMRINYSTKGKVRITMFDYVENVLSEAPEDMDGTATTPAANHLFEVNEDAVPVDKATAEFFHHMTAKLLFLCKRARPDIQTTVAFLSTRVKGPDADDYKKLHRVIQYLRGTPDMPLTLEADDTRIIKWWVDASFAVNPDMKSHTGGMMSMGKGATYGTSSRQKLNTHSSTEAETVGLHDVLPQIIWTRNFLE